MSKDAKALLSEQFSGMVLELLNNEAYKLQHFRQFKKFAVTMNFYSTNAYYHLRTIFTLPHPRALGQWASTQPGFSQSFKRGSVPQSLTQPAPSSSIACTSKLAPCTTRVWTGTQLVHRYTKMLHNCFSIFCLPHRDLPLEVCRRCLCLWFAHFSPPTRYTRSSLF